MPTCSRFRHSQTVKRLCRRFPCEPNSAAHGPPWGDEMVKAKKVIEVPGLKLKQWVDVWDDYEFDDDAHRRKPGKYLYMFSMRAAELRALSDVYKRERVGDQVEGIQRFRDGSRTSRIQRYVQSGYPFGDLKAPQQTPETFPLRKPGWLPTAIVINILVADDVRHGKSIAENHIASISENGSRCTIEIPDVERDEDDLRPFEVIDGQHRLWAFDNEGSDIVPDDFELPVVAFHGLDIAWQAYLFWSINVSPKRINPSHAFDLYPLLRTQDWLERVGELTVYREARAQELAEIMYVHDASPWHHRINMLGEKNSGSVSQATWVRALLSTFLSTGRGTGRHGLFQSNIYDLGEPLEWSRPQQAAFIIQSWIDLQEAVAVSKQPWVRAYSGGGKQAFSDKSSLLNQDQGVRAVLNVTNDVFFHAAVRWKLDEWFFQPQSEDDTSAEDIEAALRHLRRRPFRARMKELAEGLSEFDWRSLEGPGVDEDKNLQVTKRSYRGSGGYAALRNDVLGAVAEFSTDVGEAAAELLKAAK